MRDSFLTFVIVSTLLGCAAAPEPEEAKVDLEAVQVSLMNADRAWAEAYSKSDSPADAFVTLVEDDAYLLPPDAPMAQGKDAIRSIVAELETRPGFSITWAPNAAEAGSSGDLGYTIGTYEMRMAGPDGKPIRIDGKYMTVWKKQEDGTWKVAADMFNANGPPSPVDE